MITVYVRYLKTGESYPVNTTCKTWANATRQAKLSAQFTRGWLTEETTTSIANPAKLDAAVDAYSKLWM